MYLVRCKPQYFIYYGISSFPRIWNVCSTEVFALVGHHLEEDEPILLLQPFCFNHWAIIFVRQFGPYFFVDLICFQRSWKRKPISDMGLLNYVWGYLVNNVVFGPFNSVAYCWYCRGPLLYSYVIQNSSWEMGFWFAAIPLGICLLLVFLFVPEVRQLISFYNLTMIAHR